MPRGKPGTAKADQFAEIADRLWHNADFQHVFNALRQRMIGDIETVELDGSDEKEQELCRYLLLLSLKAVLAVSLKTAEIKARRSKT